MNSDYMDIEVKMPSMKGFEDAVFGSVNKQSSSLIVKSLCEDKQGFAEAKRRLNQKQISMLCQ